MRRSSPPRWEPPSPGSHIVQSDTDRTGFDTGAFASTGTSVASKGVALAAEALRERILEFAAAHTQVPREMCRLDDDAVICGEVRLPLADLRQAAEESGHLLALSRKAYGSPRSVAFNVHGFRIAVHPITGEIVILQSVQAADAGTVINPMQLRGQVEGAVSQGIGWALYERIVIDDTGKIVNPQFRNYRIPAYADIPRTEVYFADTCDPTRPARGEGHGRVPDQPGRPGAGQRAGRRHRHPLPRDALPPGPHLPADLREARGSGNGAGCGLNTASSGVPFRKWLS